MRFRPARLRVHMRRLWRAQRSLGILAAITLFVLALDFLLLLPWSESAAEGRKALERDISRLRGETGRVNVDLDFIESQSPNYKRLLDNGWLAAQDRLLAAEQLESLGGQHGLARLDYQFQPERRFIVKDPKLRKLTFVETQILLTFDMVLDLDLRAFLADVQATLPGAVEVTLLELGRRKNLELSDLLALEAGERPTLIEGSATLAWRTLELDGKPATRGQAQGESS